MAFSKLVFLMVCASVSFIGIVESEEPELTEFGKKVKECMSDETYDKLYFIKEGSTDDDLEEAVKKSAEKFAELMNITNNKAIEEKAEKENEKLGIDKLTPSLLFHGQTYGISKSFTDLGLLNSTNIDDLAQTYCDSYEKVAKTLDNDDLVSVFVALSTASADFFIAVGQTSEKVVKRAERAYIAELKKYLS